MARKNLVNLSVQEWARLKSIADQLRKTKPRGWSVIFSDNEVVVKPAHRGVGKFSISLSRTERFRVAFFSRELNYWNKSAYYDENSDVIAEMWDWITAEVLVPTKRTEPTCEAP